jgi:hypothetical protein
MRWPTLLACLALVPFLAAFASDAESRSVRRLVISAPNVDHAAYREQAAQLLPAWSGLVERDFVLETRFGAPAFSVVLIGKDGGEKLRRRTPLAPEELFAIVDAMPMRQAEVRTRRTDTQP